MELELRMLKPFEDHDFSSQNLLFKLWKYGLILPEFHYDHSKKNFRYRRSYARFLSWIILFSLSYIVYKSNISVKDSAVIMFVTTVYNFLIVFNTWFSIVVIYFSIGIIENMSEKIRTISELEKNLGIYGYLLRKRGDVYWLVYEVFMYIIMFVSSLSLSKMDDKFKITNIVIAHIFFMLDIECQQLLIFYKHSISFHLEQLNSFLEKGHSNADNLSVYDSIIQESKKAAIDFMSICCEIILTRCFYVSYSIIVSLFMRMEFTYIDLSFFISWLTIILWYSFEVVMILIVVHQDDSIYKEVGPIFIII